MLLLKLLLLLDYRGRGRLHLNAVIGRRQRSHGRTAEVLRPEVTAVVVPAVATTAAPVGELQLLRHVIRCGHVTAVPVIAAVGLPRPLVARASPLIILLLLEEVIGRDIAVLATTNATATDATAASPVVLHRRHRPLLLLLASRAAGSHYHLLLLHRCSLLDIVGEFGRRHPVNNETNVSPRTLTFR